MPVLNLALAAWMALQGAAPQPEYARGELIDPLVSPSDPSQRYVLYLPKGTDPNTPRPILYVLDYRGRGRVAAEVFQAAAESLGWIIMSSYTAGSDGPGLPNALALQTMWRDSHALFPVDDRRTYIAGLSGTARMATLFAAGAAGRITGVIGAAAGFSPDAPPSKTLPFLYYGTAGDADYNFWEMQTLATRLERAGVAHRIAFFEGPHRWMPPELAEAALAWMELRAMKAGTRQADAAFVDARWSRDLSRSASLEADGRLWQASRLLASMADDYAGLRPQDETADVVRRSRALGATEAAQAQARRQAREATQHAIRVNRALQIIGDAYPKDADGSVSPVAKVLLDLDITGLRRAAASRDEEGLAAARLLAQLDVQTGFYLPVAALAAGDDQRARFYLDIAEAIRTDDAYAWYLRAVVHARMRQPARAVQALERAIGAGFRTVDALEHNAAFEALRQRPEFARVLDDLREKVRGGI